MSYVQTIFSVTSGGGNFVFSKGRFGKALSSIFYSIPRINFVPFTEEEFEHFQSLHSGSYLLSKKDYKSVTNYNPSLLVVVRGITEMEEAQTKIFSFVRSIISEIMTSLNFAKWITNNLPLSTEMLFYSANGISLHRFRKPDYTRSWVCYENITYICNTKEDNTFELALNFPTCIDILYEILAEKKNDNKIHDPIIDGLDFERVICSEIKTLEVACSKKDEGVSSQPDLKAMTFLFKYHVTQQSNSPIKNLLPDVLYHVRPCHPLIDAVTCVKVDDEPWLLLIQVSLSTYKSHNSKFTDINNQINGCERTPHNKDCTWINYYRQLVPKEFEEGLQCMYIYISPKDFIEKEASIYITRNKDCATGVYFGLVMKNSDTATFISLKETEVTKLYL